MRVKPLPSVKKLNLLLICNLGEGTFIWRARVGLPRHVGVFNECFAGKIAGTNLFINGKPSYRTIKIDGSSYLTHRLIYKIATGEEPAILDHIDGDGLNNKINNLRPVTSSQNNANAKSRISKVGRKKGTRLIGSRWSAQIGHKGKAIYLGRYDTENEAHQAYCQAAKEFYGEFSHA